jgi:PAS domain S-box-containing protein
MPKSVKKERLDRRIAKASVAEGRFPGPLEAVPDAMVVVDQTGRIVLVNSQTERLFGYQREELLGHDVEVLLPEHLRERHRFHRMSFLAEPRTRLPLL